MKKRVSIWLSEDELLAIDDYWHVKHQPSRAEAIRALCRLGLAYLAQVQLRMSEDSNERKQSDQPTDGA